MRDLNFDDVSSKFSEDIKKEYHIVCVEHCVEYGTLHDQLFEFLFVHGNLFAKVKGYDKMSDKEQWSFSDYYDELMDLETNSYPGLIVESYDVYDTPSYDMLEKKDMLKDLEKDLIQEAEDILKDFLDKNS